MVSAVLEGLPGIVTVKMYLDRDAFQVAYDCGEVDVDRILQRVRLLGYEPREIELDESLAEPRRYLFNDLPEPVQREAVAAANRGELLFLDFYADWCAPCRMLDKNVLSAPEVQEALVGFRFVKVDTDRFPAISKHFGVVGLPTLVVLNELGEEIFRHIGPMTREALLEILGESKHSQSGKR